MAETDNINKDDEKPASEPEEETTENEAGDEEACEKLKASDELNKALEEAEETVADDEKEKAETVKNLEMSDALKAALLEAEGCVDEKGDVKPAQGSSDPEEELEVDVEFDPNAVDNEEDSEPEAPSKKEVELKMQILDLRHKVRQAEDEVEKKIKEMKQNADEAKRLKGQLEGYKARIMKEKADNFNYGHEPLLKELLPVIDNFSRALEHAEKEADIKDLSEGVELILRQLLAVMAKFNVEKVESLGKEFNPEIHQAMVQITDNSVPPNTVVDVHQEGYLLKDRLLRPAMVGVSKEDGSKSADAKDDNKNEESEVPVGEKTEDE
jgi:molecular chaperone GrpE